jgi:translation initiation factor 4G
VFRTVKAMLNKLTPTNFDRLVGGIMKANINSERKLKGSIDLIFEKAIDEPAFVETYGKLANAMTAVSINGAKKTSANIH